MRDILLASLILIIIWSSPLTASGTQHESVAPTITTTTQVLNLDTTAVAAAIANGLHQFDASTDSLQFSTSVGTYKGSYAFSTGLAMTLNRSVLLSGAVTFEEGGGISGGGAVGVQFK